MPDASTNKISVYLIKSRYSKHQDILKAMDKLKSSEVGDAGTFYYGENHYISFQVQGNRFSGFDYEGNSHFSGSVNGNSITVYDYGVSSYFNFSI